MTRVAWAATACAGHGLHGKCIIRSSTTSPSIHQQWVRVKLKMDCPVRLQFAGFQELRTFTRTKFQADMTASGANPSVAGKGARGVGSGYPPAVLAGDGYVFAALTMENAPTGTVELVA